MAERRARGTPPQPHRWTPRRRHPPTYSEAVWRRRGDRFDRVSTAVAELELPAAVFKTCPWQPRTLMETGLRQWLRCCAAALRDHQIIGMPSHAVDEAWHGLILCTARYAQFCTTAYGEFLHHHPEGGALPGVAGASDPADEQLRRTVIAWSLVSRRRARNACCGISTSASASRSRGASIPPGWRRLRRLSRKSKGANGVGDRIGPPRHDRSRIARGPVGTDKATETRRRGDDLDDRHPPRGGSVARGSTPCRQPYR